MTFHHCLGDLAYVLTGVAIFRCRVTPGCRHERCGEPINLRARVVEVVLRGDSGTVRTQQPGQRVTHGSPSGSADVNRTSRISRDELQVQPLTGKVCALPVRVALLDDCARDRPGGR